GRSPEISQLEGPVPGIESTRRTDAVDDRALGGGERVAPLAPVGRGVPLNAAPVDFRVVHAPGGVHRGIGGRLTAAARSSDAGLIADGGVDAGFEALRMNVVGDRFHSVREVAAGNDVALAIAVVCPAVVDVDELISSVLHAASDHGIGGCRDDR